MAGFPPLAKFGLALVTPLALLVALDPAAKQGIGEQGVQMVILYFAALMGIAAPLRIFLTGEGGLVDPDLGHDGSSSFLLLC